MNRNLVHLISQAEIVNIVRRLAVEIDRDYQDRSLVLVGILKGSFIFLADLVRGMATIRKFYYHIPLKPLP